ncbi:hypothetical protein BJY04DRAFT_27571 [Aspergillus karnatakaensis]|uniref:hybrid sensor histidine kinase/response regulator n=1 Tax=Aspergillus karnatakaensis TaxID=1810916 RepID=UPI003CCD63E4
MSTVGYRPSPCEAERERLREVAKYYCIVDRPSSDNDIRTLQGDERPDHNKRLASDTALTGLARLGVLQFGCNRAFVSIIDEANQHVIAEATASVSLYNSRKHQSDDGLYLGTRSLHLGWGVVPHTIRFFTNRNPSTPIENGNLVANSSRYIVRDFTKEDCYKDRPYVVDWPSMRFYAAVPIRSPAGYVLGSYCIVDDKPRSDFDDNEVESMQEIADAIAQHLETVRLSHCHRRTETLVKSLTTFVKDHDSFDPTDTYQPTPSQSVTNLPGAFSRRESSNGEAAGDAPLDNPSVVADGDGAELVLGPCSPSDGITELSSLFSKVTGSEQTELSLPTRNIERPMSPMSATGDRTDSVPRTAPTVTNCPISESQPSEISIANSIAKIFTRASILLRDSMDLDGVLFVDASRCNAGVVLSNDTGTWEPLPSTLNPSFLADPYPSPAAIPGVGSLSKASENPCTLLGRALRANVKKAESHRDFNISEKLLDDLMSSFPQGHIFDLSDLTPSEWNFNPTDSTDLCRQLAYHFPCANSVLFSPIWDWNKSRWLAGTLVWTSDVFRALGADELHYFKAFGDSIISEVARVDWATTQKSKSAFMSSVSHELRSPLHGILASAELLGTASLPPQQQHLVGMVEACGLTLLDTLNHLLDFSGINNLSALEESTEVASDIGVTSLETAFDLGDLVEEVVEVQYTGQNLPKAAEHLNEPPLPSPQGVDYDAEELSVIVRVEDTSTWKIHSVPGAWRRIVMNILGNSLKWTKSGFVEVSLSKVRRKSDPSHVFALLSVTDTGCGIASDFLRHNLFSPFAQENALSEGLGLGLSIVRQLVASLDGHLNVRSEVGVGTQVDIFVPVETLQPPALPRGLPLIVEDGPTAPPVRVCLIGFNDYPGLKETPTGILPAEAKRKLAIRSCLTGILAEQGGWSISSSESFCDSEGDVAIIEEIKFHDALKSGQLSLHDPQRLGFKRIFIILNSKTPTSVPMRSSHLIRVSQPFGCRKFRNAVVKVHELLQDPEQELPPLPEEEPISDGSTPEPTPPPIDDVPSETIHTTRLQESITKPGAPLVTETVVAPEPLHLLIVDDNDINLKILATFAGKIGCTYDTASDGLIALNKFKESRRRYDLILMDISMPVMDGIVSTNKIRQFEEDRGLMRSRIMAVTGVASTDMQQRAKAAGIDEYLVKPVSLAALKKVIAAL